MTLTAQLEALTPPERFALLRFSHRHGARVRRAEAKLILGIRDNKTFRKVVDANPHLRHRIPGEDQDKYLTAVLFLLLPAPARCATRGEEY